MRFSPSGALQIDSTASACVWSTYVCGRIACRIVSTDGAGAPERSVCVASSFTICGSDSAGSCARRFTYERPTGVRPCASIVSRSQPLPFT